MVALLKQSNEQRVYTAVRGSTYTNEDATIIGPELERLSQAYGTEIPSLTPSQIIAAAQDISSPLHQYFDWDRDEAAHKWHLVQARHLVNAIRIEIVTYDRREQTRFSMPHMVSVKTSEERAYVPIGTVLETPELLGQIREQAERSAQYWYAQYKKYRRFEQFTSLGPLFDAIESIDSH